MLGFQLRNLRADRGILILPHNNPDPDAIAAAWGVRTILKKTTGREAAILFGGLIGRAENRAMVKTLGIPMTRFSPGMLESGPTVIMVDCQPYTGNSSLPESVVPDVVIDHHPPRKTTRARQWTHIDPRVGAVSSLITRAFLELELEIPRRLATALFYAVRSETRDLGWEHSRSDQSSYLHLLPRVDFRALHRIEFPELSPLYYRSVKEAIVRSRIRKDIVVCPMGPVPYPELPAEIADFLILREGINVSFAAGLFQNDLYVSMRSLRKNLDLSRIIRGVLRGLGTGGGHERMAGGKIPGVSRARLREVETALIDRLFRRFRLASSTEKLFV